MSPTAAAGSAGRWGALWGARRADWAAGIAVLVGPDREEEVQDAIVKGLETHRAPDGNYRLQNTFHFLIARAR